MTQLSLLDTVVKGGYCVGCGSCAVVDDGIEIRLDEFGKYTATGLDSTQNSALASSVCPFSNDSLNEDEISNRLYSSIPAINYDNRIGYYLDNYAGYVKEDSFRNNGSSGGMGTWILHELFQKGLVDGVIHVKESHNQNNSSPLFDFGISSSLEEICKGAKSRYYPVQMSNVLKEIKTLEGRYAIIGVSCFIKSIRLLAMNDPIINERIKFTVGLICGHEKSKRFAEMLAWQCGVHPSDLKSINFRKKLPDRHSSDYGVEVVGIVDGKETTVVKPMKELMGFNWGHGFFKYKSCDYCDDVMNETADITIGDAWLPEYVTDPMGTNVLVVRNPLINDLIKSALDSGRLNLDPLSADKIVKSQDANYRHRREEIGYRLNSDDKLGNWHPRKRNFSHHNRLKQKRIQIQELRSEIVKQSHINFHEALSNDDLDTFKTSMAAITKKYDKLYVLPLWKRATLKIVREVKKRLVTK